MCCGLLLASAGLLLRASVLFAQWLTSRMISCAAVVHQYNVHWAGVCATYCLQGAAAASACAAGVCHHCCAAPIALGRPVHRPWKGLQTRQLVHLTFKQVLHLAANLTCGFFTWICKLRPAAVAAAQQPAAAASAVFAGTALMLQALGDQVSISCVICSDAPGSVVLMPC
jgi:hypothetical protein